MDNFEHWETNIRKQLKKYFSELYDLRPSEAKLCVQYALNCASDLVANLKKNEQNKKIFHEASTVTNFDL